MVDVIDYYADAVGLQFHIDQRALEDIGITNDEPVTMNLRDVPAEMVLRLILESIDLDFMPDHGIIIVTTAEKVDAKLETRCYPFGDFIGTKLCNYPIRKENHSGDYYDSDWNCSSNLIMELIELIQVSVQVDSWTESGGPGSITPFRDVLVVQQSWPVHRKIELLLEQLRASLGTKSSVARSAPDTPVSPRQFDLSPVDGQIILDGAPVEGAKVEFQPRFEGRLSRGTTDATGRYTLQFTADEAGAMPGVYTVRVSKLIPLPNNPFKTSELLPAKYNTKSELTVEVVPGTKNTFDWDLTSD